MFYFLSKTVGYLLTPAGWLLVLLLGAWQWPHYRRRLVVAALLIVYVLGNDYLIYHRLARLWEVSDYQQTQPLPENNTVQVGSGQTVAVVLTGGLVNTRLAVVPSRPMLGSQADRLGQALYLYKTGQVGQILISGGEGDMPFANQPVVEEGAGAMAFLRLAGVPAQALRWEKQSRNTHENAVFSARILRQHYRTERCILVTSAFHMRRALACFTREGIKPVSFSGGYLQQRSQPSLSDLLLPHEQTLADAGHLIREFVGYATYRLAGYV